MTYVILASILMLCLFIAILIYYSNASFMVKLVSLPLTLACSVLYLHTIWTLIGSPVDGFPLGKWEYVSHIPTNGGATIVLWAIPEAHNDHRLYKFPYTREMQKKLDSATKKKKGGKKIEGEFIKKADRKMELNLSENFKVRGSVPDK